MNIFGGLGYDFLEEIKLYLLDNDPNKLEDLIPLTSPDSKFVQVRRRVGTKREYIAIYERVMRNRLKVLSDSEHVHFKKLLRHPMTYTATYEGEELAKAKKDRNPSSLGYVLRMLGGNDTVVRAVVYHMPSPFDTKLPVIVTRGGQKNSKERIYVLENMPAYVKVGARRWV